MRALLASLFFALAFPAVAQEAPIQSTIEAQLDAIQRDDFAAAFTLASPTIKRVFGTPENFGRMVREGYPMVYRPGAVKMLDLREVAGGLWQRVMITDTGGRTHMLDYQMVETEGGWQINAVQLLKAEGAGA